MARLRNSTFQGSSIVDVDVDALTLKRVIGNAIGDTALAHDVLTGDNSPPSATVIDHSGLDVSKYRGCPLGVPLIQCMWPASNYAGPSFYHDVGDEFFIALVPFYLPRGEGNLDVVVGTNAPLTFVASVYDLDLVLVYEDIMKRSATPETLSSRIRTLTGGTPYILGIRVFGDDERVEQLGYQMTSLFAGWTRMARGPTLQKPLAGGAQVTLATQTVSGAELMNPTSLDEALVDDNRAISSYQLSRLNQNQNALEEYLTGAPAGGNATLTLNPTGGDLENPTRSAFHDHSLTIDHPLERTIDMPLWADAFGGRLTTGASAGFGLGFGDAWEPPKLLNGSDSFLTFAEIPIYVPQCGADHLEVILLAASSPNVYAPIVDVDCLNAAGTSAGTSFALFHERDISEDFSVAVLSDVEYHPDQLNILRIRMSGGGAIGANIFAILGGCAHFKGF